MISGAHVVLYSTNPEADRAFSRRSSASSSVDAGHGWLIFALPPAEGRLPSRRNKNGAHTNSIPTSATTRTTTSSRRWRLPSRTPTRWSSHLLPAPLDVHAGEARLGWSSSMSPKPMGLRDRSVARASSYHSYVHSAWQIAQLTAMGGERRDVRWVSGGGHEQTPRSNTPSRRAVRRLANVSDRLGYRRFDDQPASTGTTSQTNVFDTSTHRWLGRLRRHDARPPSARRRRTPSRSWRKPPRRNLRGHHPRAPASTPPPGRMSLWGDFRRGRRRRRLRPASIGTAWGRSIRRRRPRSGCKGRTDNFHHRRDRGRRAGGSDPPRGRSATAMAMERSISSSDNGCANTREILGPDFVFRGMGNGPLRDNVSTAVGIAGAHPTESRRTERRSSIGTHDGDQDIFVANYGGNTNDAGATTGIAISRTWASRMWQ